MCGCNLTCCGADQGYTLPGPVSGSQNKHANKAGEHDLEMEWSDGENEWVTTWRERDSKKRDKRGSNAAKPADVGRKGEVGWEQGTQQYKGGRGEAVSRLFPSWVCLSGSAVSCKTSQQSGGSRIASTPDCQKPAAPSRQWTSCISFRHYGALFCFPPHPELARTDDVDWQKHNGLQTIFFPLSIIQLSRRAVLSSFLDKDVPSH